MKSFKNTFIGFSIPICLAVAGLSGCAMGNTSIAQEDGASLASKIIPGKTTQEEVRQMYGTPMGVQMNGDGVETWTYSMVDTKFRTYVPFAGLIAGNNGTQSKDLSIKFGRDKVVISRDLSIIHDDSTDKSPALSQKASAPMVEGKPPEARKVEGPSDKPATVNEIIGTYENRSESSFIFSLQLNKDGSAMYQETDPETQKTIRLRGKWKKIGNDLDINFGKAGKYVYTIQPNLSWADFGCRGGSFGLKNISTPKGKAGSIVHNVWRKTDMKRAEACLPL